MRHSFVIILLVFPLYCAARLLLPDAYGMVRRTIGRNTVATEAEAYELEQVGAVAAEAAAESGAVALAESAIALAPAAPILLLFSGSLVLGGMLIHELNQAHSHAKSKTNSKEEKPQLCRINIQTQINGGYDQWPLVLDPWVWNFKDVNGNGDIDYTIGETAKISCTGSENVISRLGVANADIVCHAGAIFEYGGRLYSFYELGCNRMPESKEMYRGNDGLQHNWANYWIGFELTGGGVIPLLEMFYDNKLLKYVKHRIGFEVGSDQNRAPQISSGQFWKQGMHPKSGLTRLYTGASILPKMSAILGDVNAWTWFGSQASTMDKGHLAAKTDFPYASQQSATFYYLNAAPQFHAFNAGNWLKLEKSIRNLASVAGKMTIYSGIQGVLNLHNNNNRINIYIDDQNEAPVPEYFWKVVHVDLTQKKYAFIGINNPLNDYFFNSEDWYTSHFCHQKCWHSDFQFLLDDLSDPRQEHQRVGARDPSKGVILCCMYDNDFKAKTGIYLPNI